MRTNQAPAHPQPPKPKQSMSLTILLRCHDTKQTRIFYESVLGFHTTATAEDTVTVANHGAQLIFTSQDLWQKPPVLTGTIYIHVEDVEEYFATLQNNGCVAWPLQAMPHGGKEFAVTDCNGYLVAFRQLTQAAD